MFWPVWKIVNFWAFINQGFYRLNSLLIFYNLTKHFLFIHFALKQEMDKSAFLDKIYGLTPLEEMRSFDLF